MGVACGDPTRRLPSPCELGIIPREAPARSWPSLSLAFLTSAPIPSGGGHTHGDSTRPTGTFLAVGDNPDDPTAGARGQGTAILNRLGTAIVQYRTSGVAGVERMVPAVPGIPHVDTVDVTIQLRGLSPMDRNHAGVYMFKAQDPSIPSQRHGDNKDWLRPDFISSVNSVFTDCYRHGGSVGGLAKVFVITDAGLECGGLDDAGRTDDDQWRSPHMTHRVGHDMDIRDYEDGQPLFTDEALAILRKACAGRVKRCTQEPPPVGNPSHIHIEGLQ